MSKITPCLWFDGQAEPAARYYVSLSKLDIAELERAADGP